MRREVVVSGKKFISALHDGHKIYCRKNL